MKILMTLMGLDIGGAETHVVELSKQLKSLGHDIIIVSAGGTYEKEITEYGIKFYEAPLKNRRISDMLNAYKILKSVILNERPDIVHAHARIPAFICGLIRRSIKFNFVTSVHGIYSTAPVLKQLTNWGDFSIAVSDDIKEYLMNSYKIKESNIIVSVNGIDTKKFSPENDYGDVLSEFGMNTEAKRLVYMSRLNNDVCMPLMKLLDMFEDIEHEIPGLELLIIGDGNSYEEISLKANGINTRLKRKAVVTAGARTDVNRLLSTATASIGVARAILESMAMAKPVIVTGAEGYIGIYDSSKTDIAVSNNFTCRGCMPMLDEKFKEDIITVLKMNEHERRILGAYGRNTVKEHYSLDRMTQDALKLYALGKKAFDYDASILGYYGFKNSGDDALLHAIVRTIRNLKPDARINALSMSPKETKDIYNVDATQRYHIFSVRKTIKNSKIFILGGGSLIQDVTSTKSILYYLYITRMALRLHKPVMLYANGIGPVNKSFNKRLAKKILNRVNLITLRDEDSLEELNKLGVNTNNTIVTADPVFSLDLKDSDGAEQILKNSGITDKYACISVRKWDKAPEGFVKACAEMADYIYLKHGLVPVFIPMHYPYDASFARNIVKEMKSPGKFISRRLNIGTIISLVEKSEIAVSVRLHLCIYAVLCKIPVVGIAYDPKISSFLRNIDMPYYLDPRSLCGGDYKSVIDKLIKNREDISAELAEKSEALHENSLRTAELAVKLMEDNTI